MSNYVNDITKKILEVLPTEDINQLVGGSKQCNFSDENTKHGNCKCDTLGHTNNNCKPHNEEVGPAHFDYILLIPITYYIMGTDKKRKSQVDTTIVRKIISNYNIEDNTPELSKLIISIKNQYLSNIYKNILEDIECCIKGVPNYTLINLNNVSVLELSKQKINKENIKK